MISLMIEGKSSSKKVTTWMCLERCGDNSSMIAYELEQIKTNLQLISGVSFEMYNLGPNSTLLKNNLTLVGPTLVEFGIETYPMISSYPYPPDFIDWMRQVFKNPNPFLFSVVTECFNYGFTGINVDWEPTVGGTEQDAIDYANFLTYISRKLHQFGLKVTVDIAHWNQIWNWTLLSNSEVDNLFLMDTYTGNFTYFEKYLSKAVNTIDEKKLGIGLESVNDDNHNLPYTEEELKERFNLIKQYDINQIDIWDMPIPDIWWPFISEFVGI